jgi:hypothetical protein
MMTFIASLISIVPTGVTFSSRPFPVGDAMISRSSEAQTAFE